MKHILLIIGISLISITTLMPMISAGDFSITITPPDEPVIAREISEIRGTHQLIPVIIDKILPSLWMSQYSSIEITDQPLWLTVTFPDREPITPPDGTIYPLIGYVSIDENAPMNAEYTVLITVTTGRYMRTIFPSWFPLCEEYTIDKSVLIRTGEWQKDNQNNDQSDESIDGNELQGEKIIKSSNPEEMGTCLVLVLILSIFTILVAVFLILRNIPPTQ